MPVALDRRLQSVFLTPRASSRQAHKKEKTEEKQFDHSEIMHQVALCCQVRRALSRRWTWWMAQGIF